MANTSATGKNASRPQFYADSDGAGLERILGAPKPALWMRPASRLPSIEETRTLCGLCDIKLDILFWRVARKRELAEAVPLPRAFQNFPHLRAHRLSQRDVQAQTAIDNKDYPSWLDLANGTNCEPEEFDRFVNESTFGRLSGAIFGKESTADQVVSALAAYLEGWSLKTRATAEHQTLRLVDEIHSSLSFAVLVVTDSNMRCYWAVPLHASSLRTLSDVSESFVAREEFGRWESVGWDLRSLQRAMAPDDSVP